MTITDHNFFSIFYFCSNDSWSRSCQINDDSSNFQWNIEKPDSIIVLFKKNKSLFRNFAQALKQAKYIVQQRQQPWCQNYYLIWHSGATISYHYLRDDSKDISTGNDTGFQYVIRCSTSKFNDEVEWRMSYTLVPIYNTQFFDAMVQKIGHHQKVPIVCLMLLVLCNLNQINCGEVVKDVICQSVYGIFYIYRIRLGR